MIFSYLLYSQTFKVIRKIFFIYNYIQIVICIYNNYIKAYIENAEWGSYL